MAAEEQILSTDAAEVNKPSVRERLRAQWSKVLQWVLASKVRKIGAGTVAVVFLVVLFGTGSYLGHVTVLENHAVSLEAALEALDNKEFDRARKLVGKMKQRPGEVSEFGGYLFVLGAVKANQAELEWSEERGRAIYLVAARYLQKSRELGVPPERKFQLMYLLGRSLIQANQPRAGIDVLKESLREIKQPPAEMHQLLASAYLSLPNPDLTAALHHVEQLAAEESLSGEERQKNLLTQADILVRLSRFEEAQELLNSLDESAAGQAARLTISGRIQLAAAKAAEADSSQQRSLVTGAVADFREAQRVDSLNGETTRQAMVLIGQCHELLHETKAAVAQYDRVSSNYGDTPESILATLAKGRLLQDTDQPDKALAAYRSVIESAGDPLTYANPLMPLADLQKQLLRAQSRFLEQRHFHQALALVDHFASLYGPAVVAEFTAVTHHAWGEANLNEAYDAWRRRSTVSLESEGRYHFRAAGRAYENLAELRRASRKYTNDLWAAAENYFLGQSYTHASKVLDKYLLLEARHRRALALLRYGQSQLAVGKTQDALAALQECIEMHPRDANLFAARVECANAYLVENQPEKAEALLLDNLTGDTLRPESPEWRDSLFLLGTHLHAMGRYDEAIDKLQEAAARYPDASQTLMARYTIARSFHKASEAPAKVATEAKTENERQKNRKLRDQYLEDALRNYLDVQRRITIEGRAEESLLTKALLRNCYMMQGTVLFQLRRYEDARRAYANVSTLYQNEPFVLESFVHIANCWHRLNQPINARQTIAQAKLVLERLPKNVDFKDSTNFSRQQWQLLLSEMAKW